MRTLTVLALLAAFAFAACGDDGEAGSGDAAGENGGGRDYGAATAPREDDGGEGQTLRISADPGGALSFDRSSLSAEAGRVTIVMQNPSDLPHAVEIVDGGPEATGETVGNGGVSRATAELEAGDYEYICPVGNHADAGMTGTLTVR